MMKLDVGYSKLLNKPNPTTLKLVLVLFFIIIDSLSFLSVIALGSWLNLTPSFLSGIFVSPAYWQYLLTGWLSFLLSLNLFATYHPSHLLSYRRLWSGILFFGITGSLLPLVYPDISFFGLSFIGLFPPLLILLSCARFIGRKLL